MLWWTSPHYILCDALVNFTFLGTSLFDNLCWLHSECPCRVRGGGGAPPANVRCEMKLNQSTSTSSLQLLNAESLFNYINSLITVLPMIYLIPVHVNHRSITKIINISLHFFIW